MSLKDLLKQIYNYLDSVRKPFDKEDRIFLIRRAIDLVEDGLRWKDIKNELKHSLARYEEEGG
ncbi:unnamed protein product [marine sediment metagenome]|uniref:Uncharacterized protein n=1 Tax=marine sediment metagenome TaxID=412755 RepID=X1M0G3_9ZZZZ